MQNGEKVNGHKNGHVNGDAKTTKKHFVIVGGSLGGLSTALALRDLGHNTTILERNPEKLLHNQGAGIVAGGDSLAFLKKYNRCNRDVSVPSEKRQYLNQKGEIVHERVMAQNMTSWDLTYYLMRANYDGVESEYCEVPERESWYGEARHMHGCKVVDFELKNGGEGVRVFYEDSTNEDKGQQYMDCDVLVAADGPSSTIRKKVFPDTKRTYAGYCALRGTVPENDVTPECLAAFKNRFAFYHAPGIQALAYLIPGINGSTTPGSRLVNYVCYSNFPDIDSPSSSSSSPSSSADSSSSTNSSNPESGASPAVTLADILTDKDGVRHRITMPPGLTSPHQWDIQKKLAKQNLPPQFAELALRTSQPFVQAITDVEPAPAPSWDTEPGKDRVVFIGDALAGFRPHTVASTSQACFDAMRFADYVSGRMGREEWRRDVIGYARWVQRRGTHMGVRSQFGVRDEGVEGGKWKALGLEELIQDRDDMSVPLKEVVWPEWATRLD